MKTKGKTSLIILITLVLMASISTTKIAKADSLQITTSDKYLIAGQENSITINLRNVGDKEIVGVQSVLTSTTSGLVILEDSQRVYTSIESGKMKSYSPVIYVDKAVPLGSYTFSLTVTYQKITFEYVTSTVTIGIIVSEAYTPKLNLKINQDNITATTGTTIQPTYTFENVGDDTLSNLEFIISSDTSYLKVEAGDVVREDQLISGETAMLTPVVSVLDGKPTI